MSDDPRTEAEREQAPRPPEPSGASHDDIMKRLLDYQRRKQEGASKEEAASSVWATVSPPAATEAVDPVPPPTTEAVQPVPPPTTYPEAPAPSEAPPAESRPAGDADVWIERLQGELNRLGSKVGEMRQVFQDMAIAADERLAAIESEIARVRSESERSP